jgi:hypothetical protein
LPLFGSESTVIPLLSSHVKVKKYKKICQFSTPNIIKQIKSRRTTWAKHVAQMEEKMKLFKVLVGKPEGKTTQRLRRIWENKMKMGLRETSWESAGWIHMAQYRAW